MKTRQLGRSGVAISEIGLGTNYVGGHNLYQTVDESEGIRLVHQALDEGISFFDTADSYGDGRSEELLCKALAGRGESAVVATKGAYLLNKPMTDPNRIDSSPAYLRRALEDSLRRLGRDSIDLYYIHRPDGKTPPEESYGALMQFKKEGLIRAAGVSNFSPAEIRAALTVGPIDAVQGRYNLFQREAEAETLALCREHGISFIPWGPLAYGLLGGRYTASFRLPPGDWRSRTGLFEPAVYERNLAVIEKLKTMAAGRKTTPAAMAIQWLLARREVGSVIAGAKSAAQVQANVQAAQLELSADEVAAIGALTA